jgi:hypothetical protein
MIRAASVLFAFGSLLTLVDAVLTRELLRNPGMTERWVPVRIIIDVLGVDLALAVCSIVAVGGLAAVAWGVARARPPLASAAFVVLCFAVGARMCGCANNFGVMLT